MSVNWLIVRTGVRRILEKSVIKSGLSVSALLISFYLAGMASERSDLITLNGTLGAAHSDVAKGSMQSYRFSVYPNPTSDNVWLRIEEGEAETLKYQLFDLTGTRIHENNLEETETLIQMEHLAPSLYFLKIKKDQFTVTLLKIIKY